MPTASARFEKRRIRHSGILDFNNTPVGAVYHIGPVRITKEKIIAFAEEYDPLPLHLDEEYAKTTRHGRLIAPGVMTFMSIWARFIGMDYWGRNMLGGRSTRIEWFHPVYADDDLMGELTITGKSRRNPHNGFVVISTRIFNQNGVKVIEDITEMVVAGQE
ncbi:MAG: MaoC family dehydratase N-terminal domain-containing protein [Planctomycetes bacterium]|nr:MaoC family dehydratase N-terminal domain-containing protein [Planctomycetota bacterium]